MDFHCNYNVANPLGKGEVVSSILTGSTRKPSESAVFCFGVFAYPPIRYATKHEHDNSTRGKSVEDVRMMFREEINRTADWLKANKDQVGTAKFRRIMLTHSALISCDGGLISPDALSTRLIEIAQGKHDPA